MKFEMELVNGGPLAAPGEGSDKDIPKIKQTTVTRRALRETTDDLLQHGMREQNFTRFATHACETMLLTAAALLDSDYQAPTIADFAEALQALVEDSRAVLDKGLMIDSRDTIMCGAVMMELTIRGACAALGLPYDELMQEVKKDGNVQPILVKAGLIAEPREIFNDEATSDSQRTI